MDLVTAGIAAGANIISGLLGKSSAKKAQAAANHQAVVANQTNWDMYHLSNQIQDRYRSEDRSMALEDRDYNRAIELEDRQWAMDNVGVDFQKLRDDATAAGFNPLSVLGSSSSYESPSFQTGSFMGSTGISGQSAVGAPYVSVPQIGVSSNSFIGDMVSGLSDIYTDYASDVTERETRSALMEQEHLYKLEEIKAASTAYNGAGFSVDRAARAAAPATISGGGTVSSSGLKFPAIVNGREDMDLDSMVVGGSRWDFNPNTSDAAVGTNRYGDGADIPLAIGVFANDWKYNQQKGARDMLRRNQQYADKIFGTKSDPSKTKLPSEVLNQASGGWGLGGYASKVMQGFGW